MHTLLQYITTYCKLKQLLGWNYNSQHARNTLDPHRLQTNDYNLRYRSSPFSLVSVAVNQTIGPISSLLSGGAFFSPSPFFRGHRAARGWVPEYRSRCPLLLTMLSLRRLLCSLHLRARGLPTWRSVSTGWSPVGAAFNVKQQRRLDVFSKSSVREVSAISTVIAMESPIPVPAFRIYNIQMKGLIGLRGCSHYMQ